MVSYRVLRQTFWWLLELG